MKLIQIGEMIINGDQIATIVPKRATKRDSQAEGADSYTSNIVGVWVEFIDGRIVGLDGVEAWTQLSRMAG